MPKVVAIGELLIDFTMQALDQDHYPTMKAHPGGAPGNYLAALSAYGISTGLLAKVGDDAFGSRLIDTLLRVGVNMDGVIVDPKIFTTLAFVTLDETGNRSFDFARKPGADTMLTWAFSLCC
ncbi:MAG: PfkB family carbohydrate kinase [Saccharofermentanales bacterium]|jgi:fructokinase